ncbi:hypothetical protein L228DRAFT_246437 [Xylona heveae TC161]|uniref:F-box domain-containing protein n=1 Tax=Xylona heveae (strain CBS 132557 / TC161) TaxID=1328760 RepID=A0A165HJX1_XYLHT|nr:hypothetical protein L228DRAFT_246437 [Xylona heveae TC161]KZF23624.1 hypothetical protein L228DRAFT_246437 [Xylona heveae TC161]
MDQMPQEILELIFSHCDFTSLKQARLVCRSLADAIAPTIFEVVWIALLPESLSKLEQISRHEIYKSYVRKIVYLGDILPAFGSLDRWKTQIDERPRIRDFIHSKLALAAVNTSPQWLREHDMMAKREWLSLPRIVSSPEVVGNKYKRYQYQMAAQADMIRTGFDMSIILTAVGRLENLKDVVVETCHYMDANRQPLWSSFREETLIGPDEWNEVRRRREDEWRRAVEGVRHISSLLLAIHRAGLQPRSLEFQTVGLAFWDQNPISFLEGIPSQWTKPLMRGALHNLRRLKLRVEYDVFACDEIMAGLREFLLEANELDDLSLELAEENNEGSLLHEQSPKVLGLLDDLTWPRLRKLLLSSLAREDKLISFLGRHASTLKNLTLIDVILVEGQGSWSSVIRQLPHVLSLEKVYLEGLWDDHFGSEALLLENLGGDYEAAIDRYVLGEGPFPLLDRYIFESTPEH